jgi:hypothetical protein
MKQTMLSSISHTESLIADRSRMIDFRSEDLRLSLTPEVRRSVRDAIGEITRSRHSRFIFDVAKAKQRLVDKAKETTR